MNKDFHDYLDTLNLNLPPTTAEQIEQTYQRIAAKEGLPTPLASIEDVPAQQADAPKGRKPKYTKWAVLAAACLLLVVGTVALWPDAEEAQNNPLASDELIYAAADYAEIYAALEQNYLAGDASRYGSKSAAPEMTADMAMPMETNSGAEGDFGANEPAADDDVAYNNYNADTAEAGGGDYSQTNTQVANIDEGDIVKTDGQYIYILRNNDLIISNAEGENSAILSQTELIPDYQTTSASNYNQYASEIYVAEDYLAVITNKNTWEAPADSAKGDVYDYSYGYGYNSTETTQVLIYDVSNPSAPQQVESLGQDGYYLNSRLVDDTLYLISNHYIYTGIDEDDPGSYIPLLYCGNESSLVAPKDICILPELNSTVYTVISSIDLSDQAMVDNMSVLGGSSTVYMSYDNLYLANSIYDVEESEPYQEDQYNVVSYQEKNTTSIMRFALDQGNISLDADGQVDGNLLNQFSLDEYNGHLRLVTTLYSYSYKVYTDTKRNWKHYEWDDNEDSTNALWVLDENLDPVGEITDLAKGEVIYSARFSGDIGYFVTFRQVDPLFAVDLANPANPTILSQLKIPGFSQYLHNYTEGRLFGLGMDADPETGRTNGMKLTMFNTEDPANVTEKHTLLLDSYYSEALYNHKAILISAAKDLIAFPVDAGYDVYGYDDTSGFYKKGHFETSEWSYNTRGLYVEEYIYICSQNDINIIEMDSLSLVKTLEFAESDPEFIR